MKQLLKKLWISAGNLMTALMSLFAVLLFSSRKVARNLRTISKNVDTTRKAFVIGNGPSFKEVLSQQSLVQELIDGDTIVCNGFALSDVFEIIRPRYYVMLDPELFNEERIEIDESIKTMYQRFECVDWPMILFLPKGTNLKVVKKRIKNYKIQICLFNATTVVGPPSFRNRIYRNNLGLPNSRNVILPALMLMINFRYQNVYLYGADFSWAKNFDVDPRNNKLFLNDGHFYKTNNVIYEDSTYPYEKGYYRFFLECVALMLRGTEMIAEYADNEGIKVTNRTRGSFIDAFDYENVIL